MKSHWHMPLNLGVAVSFLVLTATMSYAATRTWDGSTDTDYNKTANWSNNDVPDSDDSGVLAGGGTGVTVLSGGSTNTSSAFNVRNGHVFTVNNSGGTFNVNNNLNLGRGVEADGSEINQLAGTVNLGGLDMSGNVTGGTSSYTISGGALTIGGADTFDVGGDGLTGNVGGGSDVSTFAIEGDSATVSVTSSILARASSVFSFTLGATGIDAIDTTGNIKISSGATLIVDGSSYTGGAGTIPLFSYSSRTDATEFTTETVSGFGSLVADVVYDSDSIDLVLTIAQAQASTISVNFHVGNDGDAQSDHELVSGETAGFIPVDGQFWNNINVGDAAAHAIESVFATTALIDGAGGSNAANISVAADSTYFVGYAASAASTGDELGLPGNDDDLFNSYLALNGPTGDGTPADSASISVSGLSAAYTSDSYSLIIYSDSDRRNTTNNSRQSTFTITPSGGSPVTVFVEDDDPATPVNIFDGTYIESDGVEDGADYSNYVVVEGLTASDFTLEIHSNDGGRGAISGFQIVSGAVIHSFAADDTNVPLGDSVTLTWDVSNATTLTLNPGAIDVTGTTSLVVNPSATTAYTLSASVGSSTVESTVNVTLGAGRPNIVIFLVDDMGITDTSVPFAYGSSGQLEVFEFNNFYQTPAMETLAAQGMKFTQAYATPVCSSTRVSLMTGFNTTRHGVIAQVPGGFDPVTQPPATVSHDPPNNWKRTGMQADDVAMPEILGDDGYRSIHCGKSHFGKSSGSYATNPTAIGFDVARGYTNGSNYVNYNLPNMASSSTSGDFLTLAITKAMNEEIEQAVDDGVPFLSYMSHFAVHSSFTTDPNATGDYSAAVSTSHEKFATMMEGVDQSLASIIAKLESEGVAEETLIIFMGDNGSDSPAANQDGLADGIYSDFPLRGKKASSWEGGIRVPMIAAWAKIDAANPIQAQLPIPQNSVEDDLVVVWDILPTLLNITDVPAPHAFDGYDLTPYLLGTPGTHRPQEMLMYLPIDHRNDYFAIYREDNWKLIYFFATDTFTLYDLATDPTESSDVAVANPERVLSMARAMGDEFDRTWGIQGELWPTFDSDSTDDPFFITYVDGRDAVDSDVDGLEDILEFAFGTNPESGSDAIAMNVNGSSFTPGLPTVNTEFAPLSVKARFIRLVDHANSSISYTAQFSHDLSTWEDLDGSTAVPISGTSEANGYEAVELNYPLFLSTGRKAQFYRVKINDTSSEDTQPQ